MDSYDLIEYLMKRNRKTVARSELEKITGYFRAEELYHCLELLLDEGILSPMVKDGTNGNQKFLIYNKYHVRLPKAGAEEDEKEKLREEIQKLHPLMIENGYLLKNPEWFPEYREALLAVNDFLFRPEGTVQPVSRKERSFELFAEEKFLETGTNGRFTGLLEKIGIGKETLAFYDTPDRCFPDYIPVKKDQMTILICENKDIWFNIRRIMFEDHEMKVLGKAVDGVLLGNGNQAAERGKLTDYTAFLGTGEVNYLYWGDIDREGFDIYRKVCRTNPALKIELFVSGYEKMVDLAEGRRIPESRDLREHDDFAEILSTFKVLYQEKIQKYLKENKRLPQEIVSYAVLKTMI